MSGHAVAGRRERKRSDARALVVEVALELFAERGYSSVSVAEICEAADIAVRTFYRYFTTKDEVLAEPIRALNERVRRDLLSSPSTSSDAEAMHEALLAAGAVVVLDRVQMSRLLRVVRQDGAPSHPFLRLADREQDLALALTKRRGSAALDVPDWRTRLTVARSNAAFRVWLVDLVDGLTGDPLAHLREMLEAP